MQTRALVMSCALALSAVAGCSCTDVASEEQAARAYLGIDPGVERALKLGFQGFNAASSANIPTQSEAGATSGTMEVGGQVDQGSSDNKTMNLDVKLTDYADPVTKLHDDDPDYEVVYSTNDGAPLALDMKLMNVPSGTLTGTLVGTVVMEKDLTGNLDLNLTFSGQIEESPAGSGQTARKAGTTHVTGTATSDAGEYKVDVTR
jgi:hypothetical protein